MKILRCVNLCAKHFGTAFVLIALAIILTACQSKETSPPQPKTAKTYYAEHELLAGAAIKKSDLHEAEEDVTKMIEPPETDLSQIVGRKPSRTIEEGSLVLKSDFEEQPPVEGVMWFAKEKVPKGQAVKPSSLEGRRYKIIPKHWMPITAAYQVIGRTAAVGLEKGSKISWYHLKGDDATEGVFYVLPQPTQNMQPSKEQLTARSGYGKVVMVTRKYKQDEAFVSAAMAEIFVPEEKIPQDAIPEKTIAVGRRAAKDVETGQWLEQSDMARQLETPRANRLRSVVAVKNIKAGEVISKKSIEENTQTADRVENGCDIVGLKAKRTIEKDTPILWYAFD